MQRMYHIADKYANIRHKNKNYNWSDEDGSVAEDDGDLTNNFVAFGCRTK